MDTEESVSKRESISVLSIIGIWIAIATYVSLSRSYLGFGTETDYLGGFLPEAQRLLSGEPLSIEFHPPLYASVLAFIQFFLDDWFLSGRVLTLISYTISLISSFYFFRLLINKASGWGALFALMCSTSFFYYALLTTSDVFFYCLYSCTLLLAILAYKKALPWLWIACGLFVGLVLLTRSNGFTLLALVLLPWLSNNSNKKNILDSIFLCIGIALPIAIWATIASYSGSPFMPRGTYANLALTYFSPTNSKISGDARIILESQFQNLWQVVTYDPIHIVKSYIRDLFKLAQNILLSEKLIGFPLFLFALPGLFLMAIKKDRLILFYLFIITLSQLLLVNFKGYENRLYLFLVPIYGVAIAICCEKILALLKAKLNNQFIDINKPIIVSAIIAFIPLGISVKDALRKTHAHDISLHDSVTKTAGIIPKNSQIVSRKPHLAFYSSGEFTLFPAVQTYPELASELSKSAINKPIYVYYGFHELKTRPQFKELITSNVEQAPWLTPVVSSTNIDEWVLYRFNQITDNPK